MVYKIAPTGANLKKNRFEFDLGGETLSLPKIEYVPAEADEFTATPEARELTRREFVLQFAGACDPDVEKKLREAGLHRDQVNGFYEAWLAASKVTPGESSASESS